MKLYEIINTEYNTKDIDGEFDLDQMSINKKDAMKTVPPYGERGGNGYYASVDVDANTPMDAKKTYHEPTARVEGDAYYMYIKTITNSGLAQSNPYFPRVYKVEVERDSAGRKKPSFEMETLMNAREFDSEALYNMGKKMFNKFDDMLPYGRDSHSAHINYAIVNAMKYVIMNDSYSDVKDKKLIQALRVISDIVDESIDSFHLDLHAGNIMLRGTKNGPQVVLTDPIADTQQKAT